MCVGMKMRIDKGEWKMGWIMRMGTGSGEARGRNRDVEGYMWLRENDDMCVIENRCDDG